MFVASSQEELRWLDHHRGGKRRKGKGPHECLGEDGSASCY